MPTQMAMPSSADIPSTACASGPSGTGSALSAMEGWAPWPVSMSSGAKSMRAPSAWARSAAERTSARLMAGSRSTERSALRRSSRRVSPAGVGSGVDQRVRGG